MSKLLQTARRSSSALCEFIFPAQCCLCGTSLASDTESNEIVLCCMTCLENFPDAIEHSCSRCGAEVGAYVETSKGCNYCKSDSFSFASVIAYGTYESELKQFCQLSKRPEHQDVTWLLGERLWQSRRDTLSQLQVDCLVTVPMHWTNRLVRRIHPNETLAKCLSKRLKVPYFRRGLVQRIRTKHQSSLRPSLRRKNIRDAYRASASKKLRAKNILLVDDILTTGATAHACARLLLAAGCAVVHVAVVARGIGR
ncbi:MAG TPA: hypothetical protein DD473_16790 [Planctomycetaceae bacterium]|nr:hypothetical protein [Planctomycetaceae bacterium]